MIVPGTPEAIAYIARRMRAADLREIFALRSSDDINLLISDMLQFQTSVAMRDGRPVAVVGCRQLTEAPWIWSLGGFGTDEWPKVKFSLTKFITQEMIPAMISCGSQRIICHIAAWRTDTLRWMEFMGGTLGKRCPHTGAMDRPTSRLRCRPPITRGPKMGGKTGGNRKAEITNRKAANYQAELDRQAEEKRQARITQAQDNVRDVFKQFDDDYFSGVAKSYQDHYMPDVDSQFSDATDELTYKLADAGNLHSSAAQSAFGDMQEEYGRKTTDVANAAQDAAADRRSKLANSESSLMAQIQAGTDPETASKLAVNEASVIQQPVKYDPIQDLFSQALSRITERIQANRQARTYENLNNILYNNNKSSAVIR